MFFFLKKNLNFSINYKKPIRKKEKKMFFSNLKSLRNLNFSLYSIENFLIRALKTIIITIAFRTVILVLKSVKIL